MSIHAERDFYKYIIIIIIIIIIDMLLPLRIVFVMGEEWRQLVLAARFSLSILSEMHLAITTT